MMLETLALYAAALSLLIGSGFILVGVIGLLKFNDPMTRLHAPTKVGTVGIGMLLLASILAAFAKGDMTLLCRRDKKALKMFARARLILECPFLS